MRSALFWNFTQRRLVVSYRRFGTTFVVVKFSQRCWWRFKSSGTFRPVDWSVYIFRGQQSKMKALHSTEKFVTLHQSIGRNIHQHLCENVMSHRLEYRAGPSYWYEDHCRIHKSPTIDIFSFRALWYIKTLVNTNKCTTLVCVFFLLPVGANIKNT